MLLLLVPLVSLYYVAVGFAFIIDMRREKREALEQAT
jgi:Sec-independent protein secretion pathway component TatC